MALGQKGIFISNDQNKTNDQLSVLAIIPARSGSKVIPHKNIRLYRGLPLLVHSVNHAKNAKLVTRVIVSTDSNEYAEIAKSAGAEVPFIRPAEISGDQSTDLEVMQHAIDWLSENESWKPDILVHLRPTHPVRNPSDIDAMINLLVSNPTTDSVRSVSPAPLTPFKMWFRNSSTGSLTPVVEDGEFPEAYNQPRQLLPKVFMQNASIDVAWTKTIQSGSMTGSEIAGYEMDKCFDIDLESEFLQAQQLSLLREHLGGNEFRSMRFVFDIDGIIANITPDNNYAVASPILQNIAKINQLYELGHHIVLLTARGYATGIDWSEVTQNQLAQWNVLHHELHFGKPHADFYIDDKFTDMDAIGNAIAKFN